MTRKHKNLNSEDQALWEMACRQIKPLDHEKRAIARPAMRKTSPHLALSLNFADTPALVLPTGTTRQIRRTHKVRIEARLDLHGMTRHQAQVHLTNFLGWAQQQRHLWVLIITGKGRQTNTQANTGENRYEPVPKTLRELLPQWLDDDLFKTIVASFAPAKPQDGGSGAMYVRLKNASRKKIETV